MMIEKLVKHLSAPNYNPAYPEIIARFLKIKGKELDEFWQALKVLAGQEIIKYNKNGMIKFNKKKSAKLIAGKLEINSKGFGFVTTEEFEKDIFIPATALGSAAHGDKVLIKVLGTTGKNPEGEIVKVLERGMKNIVGDFMLNGDFAFVIPDNKRLKQDIFIPKKFFNKAQHGQKVVAEIVKWPEGKNKAEGKIVEILGNANDSDLEIVSIIKQQGLELSFPPDVLAAATNTPTHVTPELITAQRRDLRHLPIVTVDSEDARDLDDAIYVEKINNDDYLLGVYIADVSTYVKAGSIIDKEAAKRATSVYLVDRVLPMLPVELSNGICSLNAGVDRLVLACEMHINKQGTVVAYEIFPAIIKVKERLSYNILREMFNHDGFIDTSKYEYLLPQAELMRDLCTILRNMRMRRGAIDFDFPEQKVKLDKKGKPVEIVQRVRTISESIIEEFMLAANETVAKHLSDLHSPSVYRVHEQPNEEKILALKNLLHNFNIKLEYKEDITPKVLQTALEAANKLPEARLLSTVMLRSLKQAKYQVENVGHFGLAAQFYTHFTSPIRRYPDLLVHRLLYEYINNPVMPDKVRMRYTEQLPEQTRHSSEMERLAAETERMTVDYKKAEYMQAFIGQEFEGFISSVTPFGFFVELENGVEGLVHMSALLNDYYVFYEDKYALIGERSKEVYRLGDKVKIEVFNVNLKERSIDFILANTSLEDKLKLKLLSKTYNQNIDKTPISPTGASKAKKQSNSGSYNATKGRRKPKAKHTPVKSGNKNKSKIGNPKRNSKKSR